jgi:hypothetical protein
MKVRAASKANVETTEIMEPGVSSFDDPTALTKAATVVRAANNRPNVALAMKVAMFILVVSAVVVDDLRRGKRPTGATANRRDGINQLQHLREIVAIRSGQDRADRNAACLYDRAVFCPWLSAIRGARPRFWPIPTARTNNKCVAAQQRSNCPDSRNLSARSYKRLITPHPTAYQSCSGSLQVIAVKSNPKRNVRLIVRIPVLHKTPLVAARSETAGHPGYLLRHGFRRRSGGSISARSSVSMMSLC